MDLNKLPRLSNSDAPPGEHDATSAPRAVQVISQDVSAGSAGGEIWISIAVGVIILLMNTRFLQFIFARSSFSWTFTDTAGNPITYPQTVFFWGDLAMVSFGLVLILEGIALAKIRNHAVLMTAFALTIVSTLLNAGYVIFMLNTYGLQLMSALAVAFGVYIAMYQWKLLKSSAAAVQ